MALKKLLAPANNDFETEVIQRIFESDFDTGVLGNNILIPHTRCSCRPDEHDLVLLLPWAAYTIDAKAWKPGKYKVPANGPIEWQNRRLGVAYRSDADNEFEKVPSLENPFRVAHQKSRVLRQCLLKKLGNGFANYAIESLVVVPDTADVEPKDSREPGDDVFTRLRVKAVGELVQFLQQDADAPNRIKLTEETLKQVADAIGLGVGWQGDDDITRQDGFQGMVPVERVQPRCPLRLRAYRGKRVRNGRVVKEVELRRFDLWPSDPIKLKWEARLERHLETHYLRSVEGLPQVERISHPDALWIVLPWYDGSSVRETVNKFNRLSLSLVRDLIVSCCGTIAALVDVQEGNLDVHPDTVFVKCDNQGERLESHRITSLMSFSKSEHVTSTVVSMNDFDNSFVSPQLLVSGHLDRNHPSNDMFAVARLAAFCFLGGDRYQEVVVKRSCFDGFPEEWIAFLQQACASVASQRFSSAQEMRRVAAGLPV